MQRYNILQLKEMEQSNLIALAKELGLEKVDKVEKDALIYQILDQQAIVNAALQTATNKKQDDGNLKKKRGRPAKGEKIQQNKSAKPEAQNSKSEEVKKETASPEKSKTPKKVTKTTTKAAEISFYFQKFTGKTFAMVRILKSEFKIN